MNLRKYLLAAGASIAAAALALAPTAQASTPTGTVANHVKVGANTTGNHAITGTLKAGASFTTAVYGTPTTLTCSSGSLTGTAHAGAPAGAVYKSMSFATLTLNCDAFLPGQANTISVQANGCAGFKVNDSRKRSVNVHDGLVDTGATGGKFENVYGVIDVPNATCPMTVVASTCTLQLGDFIKAQFDEAVKPNGSQELSFEGNDLQVTNTPGFGCLGAFSKNDRFTMNVKFNIFSTTGPIDYRTNP